MVSSNYTVVNIRKYLALDKDIGESMLSNIFSNFSCPKNLDVESFLKNNSIEFAKKNQSVTYFVFTNDDKKLVGYFCIALKSLTINSKPIDFKPISNNDKRKLERISELNEETQTYTVPAFLIGQIGKNYTNGLNNKITGTNLLNLAWSTIQDIKYKCGGVVAFLETDNNEKLLKFYQDYGFKIFDTRKSKSKTNESHDLIQLLKTI